MHALGKAMDWTADPGRYTCANFVLFLAWLAFVLFEVATGLGPTLVPTLLAPAPLWNLISWRRIADTRLWGLHLAPYLTVAGILLVFWAWSSEQGQYAGFPPPLWWQQVFQISGFPMVLTWLAATILLAAIPRKGAA